MSRAAAFRLAYFSIMWVVWTLIILYEESYKPIRIEDFDVGRARACCNFKECTGTTEETQRTIEAPDANGVVRAWPVFLCARHFAAPVDRFRWIASTQDSKLTIIIGVALLGAVISTWLARRRIGAFALRTAAPRRA